ncbi:MAG TPA: hypothetical protein VIK85_02005, partial [Coriobacteriia bacterium]
MRRSYLPSVFRRAMGLVLVAALGFTLTACSQPSGGTPAASGTSTTDVTLASTTSTQDSGL